MGDILIVAINSDKSLSCLKGPQRPLYGEKERVKLLLSLKSIDYVFVFGEQMPKEILSELPPDILVKDGDYKLSEIVGKEYVKKVCIVPFVICKRKINDKFNKSDNNCYGSKKM